MQSTESAIISSHPTSFSGTITVLLNTKHLALFVKILNVNPCKHCNCIHVLFLTVSKAVSFVGPQFPCLDKLEDIACTVHNMNNKPIELPKFQIPMFGI